MVFNGIENYKLSHNHNIVNFISTRHVGRVTIEMHSNCRGQPLNSHPVHVLTRSQKTAWEDLLLA